MRYSHRHYSHHGRRSTTPGPAKYLLNGFFIWMVKGLTAGLSGSGPVVQTMTASGVGVATHLVASAQSSYLGLFIRGGAAAEKAAGVPEGTAHMLEHVLMHQLGREQLEKHAMNGHTTRSYIGLMGQVTKQSAGALAGRLLETLGGQELEQALAEERPRVLGEYQRVRESLSFYLEKAFGLLCARPASPALITGTPESILRITAADLARLSAQLVRANNVFLVGIGNVPHQALVETASRFRYPALPGQAVERTAAAPKLGAAESQQRRLPCHITAYRTGGLGAPQHLALWGLHAFVRFYLATTGRTDLQAEYLADAGAGVWMLLAAKQGQPASLVALLHQISDYYPAYLKYLSGLTLGPESHNLGELRQLAQSALFGVPYRPLAESVQLLERLSLADLGQAIEQINCPIIWCANASTALLGME